MIQIYWPICWNKIIHASHVKQSSICHSNRLKNNSGVMRGCPPTQLAPFTAICTQQQITWSFQEIINKVRRTVSDDYVLFRVVSTFEGGKLLQFPVLGEVESWRTLSTLLLYNLRPTWVLNFVELSGRWSAVAGTLAGCLLGLEKKKHNVQNQNAHIMPFYAMAPLLVTEGQTPVSSWWQTQ